MRASRMIYEDGTSLFDVLLEKDMSFSVHDRNIQQLAIEMYKVKKGLAPTAISSLFPNVVIIDTQDHDQNFQFHK